MNVFIKDLGFIMPKKIGTPSSVRDLTSDSFEVYLDKKKNSFEIISRDYLKGLDYETKSLMSTQTQLAFTAVKECLKSIPKDYFKNKSVVVYVANGHISLDDLTIKVLQKQSLLKDTVSIEQLNKNLQRLPPLDGIKMLSTAVTHFVSREYDIHGTGNQVFCGENSGIVALGETFELLKNSTYDCGLLVGSHAPFQKNSLPFYMYNQIISEDISPVSECAFALLLERSATNTGQLAKLKSFSSYYNGETSSFTTSQYGPLTPFVNLLHKLSNLDGPRVKMESKDCTGYFAEVELEVLNVR